MFVNIFSRSVHEPSGIPDAPVWSVPFVSPGGWDGRSHDAVANGHDGTTAEWNDGGSAKQHDWSAAELHDGTAEWPNGCSGGRGTARQRRGIALHDGDEPGHDGTAAEWNDGTAADGRLGFCTSSTSLWSAAKPAAASVEHQPGVC